MNSLQLRNGCNIFNLLCKIQVLCFVKGYKAKLVRTKQNANAMRFPITQAKSYNKQFVHLTQLLCLNGNSKFPVSLFLNGMFRKTSRFGGGGEIFSSK